MKQAVSAELQAGAGFVRGAAASITYGAVGGPQASDSEYSRVGQVAGTLWVGEQGVGAAGAGVAEMGTGVGLAAPSGGSSLVLEVPGAVQATLGVAAVVGAAKNGIAIATTPLENRGNGPKASEAPGVTANGQATDKYGNKLGPSGEPQVNSTRSNTREGANNKALNEGAGSVNHNNPQDGQKPHFHPTDAKGEKKPNSTHHTYPE